MITPQCFLPRDRDAALQRISNELFEHERKLTKMWVEANELYAPLPPDVASIIYVHRDFTLNLADLIARS